MIDLISNIIVSICLLILFTAIIINFFEVKHEVSERKKSIVETGSMTGFFILIYLLIRFHVGELGLTGRVIYILKPLGLILVVAGCWVNIRGRIDLGANWANQVTLYKEQTLIRNGVYRHLRHPLYASLVWMFYGASLVYLNYLAFLGNTFIFIPFMYYRAKQEEKMLLDRFGEYRAYQNKTGMFFPRIL